MRVRILRVASVVGLCAAIATVDSVALAKKPPVSPVSEIEQLKAEALADFDGYAYRRGVAKVERALGLIEAQGAGDKPERAELHALLGIAAISGRSDTYRGIHYFVVALRLDPKLELPKNLVTPELIKLFAVAKRTVRALSKPPQLVFARAAGSGQADERAKRAKGLDHAPVDEARRGFPITIKAAVGVDIRAKSLHLFFRPAGKVAYSSVRMKRRGNVFRGEIPAEITKKGRYVHYYIEARDPRGSAVATNGSARGPNVVILK